MCSILFTNNHRTLCKSINISQDVTKPKDNISEKELTSTLTFTPVKSPTKMPAATRRNLRAKPQVTGIDDLPTTPMKEPRPSAVEFTTPVKQMTTMERLNSPVKKTTAASTTSSAAKDKAGPSKVKLYFIIIV